MSGKHETPDLRPAQHADPDGPAKGWDAAAVDPGEYSGDDYAAQFPVVDGEAEDPRGLLATATVNITRANLQTIASRTGRKVVAAWSAHDQGLMGTVVGVVMHHTGSAWGTTVAPTLAIVRDGRSDLVNALSAFYIDRAGTIYLITDKVAWHAGQGAYRGVTDGNGHFLGIEAESDGVHWTPDTVDAYVALVAEIVRFLGVDPNAWAIRHATWATPPGRKTDFAGLNEGDFRARIAARLNGAPAPTPAPVPTPPPTPASKDTDMRLIRDPNGTVWRWADCDVTAITDQNLSAVGQRAWGGLVDVSAAELAAIQADAAAAKGRRDRLIGDVHGKVVDSVFGLDGRPGPDKDDLLGQVLSLRAELRAVAAEAGQTVNVDATAVADALAASETAIDKLADAIAAKIATRLGNG